MALAIKKCRVCGKSYEACRSAKREAGVFHWQEVACSAECGTEYLRMVTEARNPAPKAKRSARSAKATKAAVKKASAPAVAEAETAE